MIKSNGKKVSSFILALCIALLTPTLTVKADTIMIPNEGVALQNPYGDSKLPSSYDGADYYDCYIPYSLTCREVGGYATGWSNASSNTYKVTMEDNPRAKDYKIASSFVNYYKKCSSSSYHGCKISEESDTNMQIATDKSGNQYYISCLPGFCYNFAGLALEGGASFPAFSSDSNGQLYDVILTDGTVLHFICGDHKSNCHTNGGGLTGEKSKDVTYTFSNLNYAQYRNIFQAAAGETLEVWGTVGGCTKKFQNKYGISGTNNRIAIIRMYNLDTDKDTIPVRSSGTGVSSKLADHAQIVANDGAYAAGDSSLSVAGSSLVKEWELVGMPTVFDLTGYQSLLDLPNRDNLGITDTHTVAQIGADIALRREAADFDTLRVIIAMIGFATLLYGFCLIVAVLLDRINSFIDISFVSLLTFGMVHYDPFEEGSDVKGYASTKKVVISAVLAMLVGMLLLSSTFTMGIGRLLYFLYSKF